MFQLGLVVTREALGRMADPVPNACKLWPTSVSLLGSRHAEAQHFTQIRVTAMAGLLISRLRGHLCPGASGSACQQTGAPTSLLLGAVCAPPPGWAGYHDCLLHAGQRSMEAPPVGAGHPSCCSWLRRLQD